MRLYVSALVMLVLTGCQKDKNVASNGFNADAAMRYIETQLKFGPRIPGTDGHRRAGDWIVTEMKQRADTVIEQKWTHALAGGGSIPLRNILARFNPKAKERILYVAHWDTRPISENAEDEKERGRPVPGANDGASGVGLLMAIADVLKDKRPSVGVDLLFVDGEDYGNFDRYTEWDQLGRPDSMQVDVLIGSRYFAKNLPDKDYQPMFGVVWDMIADKDLRIPQEMLSMQKAPEVVAKVWGAAQKLGYSDVFVQRVDYQITDDHVPLQNVGLRVIDVIDIEYPDHHKPTDTIDKISAESLLKVGATAVEVIYQ